LRRTHALAALLFAVVIPAASRLSGEGRLAWTMFSKTETYRIVITGTRASGETQAIAPTALAVLADAPVSVYLAGADHTRAGVAGARIEPHLAELAALACRLGAYASVAMDLERRPSLDAPVTITRARVRCAP
jgi:hypothetical protein